MAACPYCDSTVELAAGERDCPSCGRDRTAPRRVCGNKQCGRMTPKAEKTCAHCGQGEKSELRWKVPLIILLFALSFVLGIVLVLLGVW